LNNTHLSLLAASTTQTYERIWDSSFTDIGFNNRLFLVPGSGIRRFAIPQMISTDQKEKLKTRLLELISIVGDNLELTISSNAYSLYDEWYNNLESSIHSKRIDTYALRLMVLLSINNYQTEIDKNIVKDVIDLCNWQLKIRQQFDPIDADSNIAKLEEKIRRVLKNGPKSERELKQYTNARRSGLWIYDTAKKNLEKAKEIKWSPYIKKYELQKMESIL